jgi:hypothetical protein
MVVEVVTLRFVKMSHIDDASPGIGEIARRRFTANDGHRLKGEQDAARKKFVLMRTAGMRENRVEREHKGSTVQTDPPPATLMVSRAR